MLSLRPETRSPPALPHGVARKFRGGAVNRFYALLLSLLSTCLNYPKPSDPGGRARRNARAPGRRTGIS